MPGDGEWLWKPEVGIYTVERGEEGTDSRERDRWFGEEGSRQGGYGCVIGAAGWRAGLGN